MVKLFLILFYHSTLGNKILEYRPSVNFGQIFYDYSGNSQTAVNGDSSSTTNDDTFPTDRGAYFFGTSGVITMPPNDLITAPIYLPSAFTVLMWVYTTNYEGYLYCSVHDNDSNFVCINVSSSNNLEVLLTISGEQSIITGSLSDFSNFYSGIWNLVCLTYTTNTAYLFLNGVELSSAAIPVPGYVESLTYLKTLGYSGISFQGFLWYFVILDTATEQGFSYMSSSSSSACLSTTCTPPCSPSILDPYQGTGCISTVLSPSKNSNGVSCPDSSTGCTGNTALLCSCSTGSCTMQVTALSCACDVGQYAAGMLCIACSSLCLECTGAGVCTSCVDSNAAVNSLGQCVCNTGYFGNTPLANGDTCTACFSECSTCTGPYLCGACVAANASPGESQGCLCDTGYYGSSPLTSISSCLACYAECYTCKQTNLCDSCIATHALPTLQIGCYCASGYYGTAPLTTAAACTACNADCATCTQANLCVTCKDSNASPSATGEGCVCNSGYYHLNIIVAIGDNICGKCYPECATCTSESLCLACLASHSQPSETQGCSCNAGFWGIHPLIGSAACKPCNSECLTCTEIGACTSCRDPNSLPDSSTNLGCACNSGYLKVTTANPSLYCSACYGQCSACLAANTCETCTALNASPLAANGCVCNTGYFNVTVLDSAGACVVCDPSCLSCEGASACQYTACSGALFYLSGYCLSQCPLGYTTSANSCVQPSGDALTLQFTFESVESVYYDTVFGVPAYVEDALDYSRALLPTTASGRGLYFDGAGYLNVNCTDLAILGPEYSLSMWISPSTATADLLYRGTPAQSLFFLSLTSSYITVGLRICGTLAVYSPSNPLLLQQWNHLLVTVGYAGYSTVTAAVNAFASAVQLIAQAALVEGTGLDLVLGSGRSGLGSYMGFLFSVEVYVPGILGQAVVSSECGGCLVCPIGGGCLSGCLISEFYSQEEGRCLECPVDCPNACADSRNCSLCADNYCVSCRSFEIGTCTGCQDGYVVKESVCVPCSSGEFFDTNKKACEVCQGLCFTCFSAVGCFSCVSNSSLGTSNTCVCNLGFTGAECSERNTFYATASVFQNNTIKVIFSEPMGTPINTDNLQVFVGATTYNVTLDMLDTNTYLITLVNVGSISGDTMLTINFLGDIISANNSVLSPTTLKSKLFENLEMNLEYSIQSQAESAKTTAKLGTTIGLSAFLGISIINIDPNSFCNFMNTAELFYSAYLYNIELYPVLSEFLIGMRVESSLPNLFSYLVSEEMGSPLPSKYKNYGYATNILMLNTGVRLTVIFFAILLQISLSLLSINPWLKSKLAPVNKSFKYGIYLRFWIQLFFEFLTSISLGIPHYDLTSIPQCIDLSITCVILVHYI